MYDLLVLCIRGHLYSPCVWFGRILSPPFPKNVFRSASSKLETRLGYPDFGHFLMILPPYMCHPLPMSTRAVKVTRSTTYLHTKSTRQKYNGPRIVKFISAKRKKYLGQKWVLSKKKCPRLKPCAKTNSSKDVQNHQKMAKIVTLSLVQEHP